MIALLGIITGYLKTRACAGTSPPPFSATPYNLLALANGNSNGIDAFDALSA
jgi:hypothetical protein